MGTSNASHAPDPVVAITPDDARHSPDAGESAWADIPMAPATLAEMKLADPEYSIGTASDDAGTTTAANQATVRNRGY